jgi:ElaB/YqjD/DUF883 family membrane-anchored ribosome-binding protein
METTSGSNMSGSNISNASDRAHGAVDRVAQTAHQAVDRIASKAAPAMDRVRNTAADAADSMHAQMDDLSMMQEQWTESMRDQVRAHPLAVVGLAVLAGMLLGRLSR